MSKIGKIDLIKGISEDTGLTQRDVEAVFEQFSEIVLDALAGDDSILLPGLGTFSLSKRAARVGRNPATGAPLKIKASKGIKFKIVKAAKDALN